MAVIRSFFLLTALGTLCLGYCPKAYQEKDVQVVTRPKDDAYSLPLTEGKTCPDDCSDDYSPVCAGVEGSELPHKTFTNACQMEAFNCRNQYAYRVLREGECKASADNVEVPYGDIE